jgi:hypothetical protein
VKKLILPLAAALILVAPQTHAQTNTYEELMRQDIRTAMTEVVTEAMQLTDAESEKFWPVYREYELEVSKVWDDRIALIQRYADAYTSMDDKTADELANEAFKLRERRAKLRKANYNKMKKAVGAVVAARFSQVDSILQNIVELQVAAELPLVWKTAPETEGR